MSSDWTLLAKALEATSDQSSLEQYFVDAGGNLNTDPTREELDTAQGSALRTAGGLQVFERSDGAILAYSFGYSYSWRIGAVIHPDGKNDRAIYAKAAGVIGPFLGGPRVLDEIRGLVKNLGKKQDVSSIDSWMSWFI